MRCGRFRKPHRTEELQLKSAATLTILELLSSLSSVRTEKLQLKSAATLTTLELLSSFERCSSLSSVVMNSAT
jgi:hypothetical protein